MRILLVIICLTQISFASADIEKLRDEASLAAGHGKTREAITLYRQLLTESPIDGMANYRLGMLLMDQNIDLEEAIEHFEAAAGAGFQPGGVNYRLSRIFARTGATEKALKRLEQMASAGFSMVQLIESEADYDNLRQEPRYVEALAKISASRYPCQTDPRKRDFDFWLGDWQVTQSGQYAGRNNITSILGGCAVYEQWTSASGVIGKSFNYYDPAFDHWRQIWIDDAGNIIEFTGVAREGGIYYTAETLADDVVTHHKFEFTQNGDGSVRQFWRTSADKVTWTTIWDGLYQAE